MARWAACAGLAAALVMVAGRPLAGQPQAPRTTEEVGVLTAGSVAERAIAGGQTHAYELQLDPDTYLRMVVEQHGVDVGVVLRGPDGGTLLARNRQPNRLRPERLEVVVKAAGRHVLEVRAVAGEPSGRYTVRVEQLRPASAGDRGQAAADSVGRDASSATAARTDLEALIEDSRARGYVGGEAMALYQRGVVELRSGDAHAPDTLQEALALFQQDGNDDGEMLVLSSLGDAHDQRQDKLAALEAYEQALALADAADDPVASAFFLSKAGIVLARIGQGERAIDFFARARALYLSRHDRAQEIRAVNNIGIALKALGDHRKALAYVQDALVMSRVAGIQDGTSGLLISIGDLQRLLGDIPAARASYREALALARRARSAEEEAGCITRLAALQLLDGSPTGAVETAGRSVAMARRMGDGYGEAQALHIVGQALRQLGQLDAALEPLRAAADIRERLHSRQTLAETLVEMARLERDRGRLRPALEHAHAAVALVEALRSEVADPDLRATFVASCVDTYAVYVDILLRLHVLEPSAGHDVTALQASERARARVLFEALVEIRADIRSGVDPALLQEERSAQSRLRESSARLSLAATRPGTPSALGPARAEFAERADRLRQVQSRIRQASPRYAALTQPEPATLEAIRREVLDDDTVLLEFLLGPERSFLWAVTRTELVSQPLATSGHIEGAVRDVLRLLTERQRQVAPAALARADARLAVASRRIGELLLGAVSERLAGPWKGKRLLVVTSGALAYLPFAVLPAGPAGRRLSADHEIVYVPSASVLLALRQEQPEPSTPADTVAILADPVFQASDPRVRGRHGEREDAMPSALRRASESLGRAGFARLPFSRREAEGIAGQVAPSGLLKATDFGASRSLIMEGRLDASRVLHFATHGILESEHPSLSGLVLSLVDESGAPQDGFLRMPEIYNLHLHADLVVLSACQTALGREVRGEGLVGLTRGFMYAGARSVVASLWQVDDESTAELMKRFYRAMLGEHRRPAEALRVAQLEMSLEKRWSAPFYWAGFILQGEWR